MSINVLETVDNPTDVEPGLLALTFGEPTHGITATSNDETDLNLSLESLGFGELPATISSNVIARPALESVSLSLLAPSVTATNTQNADPVDATSDSISLAPFNITVESSGAALFSTSFDYTEECSLDGDSGYPLCGGSILNGDVLNWSAAGNGGRPATRAVAAASRTGAGYGLRHYMGDGTNINSGSVILEFKDAGDTRQKELWIRWYERWQTGFQWSGGNPAYKKMLYIYTNALGGSGGGTQVIVDWANSNGNTFVLSKQGTSSQNTANAGPTGFAWSDIHGHPSNGDWVEMEIYIKMDTDQNDGVGRAWINGTLAIDRTDLDFSNGEADAKLGWQYMLIPSNQASPDNGGFEYVDMDDIEIWNTTPPNVDGSGNPRIGAA